MMKIKKIIGIISWLPNDSTREIRKKRLEKLIEKCYNLFNINVIIIAQNWKDDVKLDDTKCTVFHYEKLGIVGARKKLREKFLESEFDYLIMLDDDAELIGTKDGAKKYLEQIDSHPNQFGIFRGTLLKLFAISKYVMSEIDYEDIEVENGEGFEDMLFVEKCKRKFSDNYFTFIRYGLDDISNSGNDEYSTWYKGQFIKKEMGDKSRKIIDTY